MPYTMEVFTAIRRWNQGFITESELYHIIADLCMQLGV